MPWGEYLLARKYKIPYYDTENHVVKEQRNIDIKIAGIKRLSLNMDEDIVMLCNLTKTMNDK